MHFRETSLPGAYLIDIEKRADERGFFARTWCREEFRSMALVDDFVQGNISFNPVRGTLRGLHFQIPPHSEVKVMRCVRGVIFDVIVDMRPDSPTYREWFGVELRAGTFQMLYVPVGFAHGFQTLEDDTEVSYSVSAFYAPGAEAGLRYDDPALAINWPLPVTRISDKDRSWPLLREAAA